MPAQPHPHRVAVVTGAASGIGRAPSLLFAEHGIRVIAADIDVDGGAETEKLVRDTGGEAVFVRVDVSDAVERVFETALAVAPADRARRLEHNLA